MRLYTERLTRDAGLKAALVLALMTAIPPAESWANPLNLATLIANPSFDDASTTVNWTTTRPNSSYLSAVPVNPVIAPLAPSSSGVPQPNLIAQYGPNFVGVRNPTQNDDLKGKLVSDAVALSVTTGTEFEISVYGNRGRLNTNGNTNGTFPNANSAPKLRIQFWGFSAGAVPTVNSSDNWSRSHTVKMTETFDFTGVDPGEWALQTFLFETTANLEYIAIAVVGQNLNHDQYVAADIQTIPEPTTATLVGLGLMGLCLRGRCRSRMPAVVRRKALPSRHSPIKSRL